MRSRVGTLAWVHESGGRLSGNERLRQVLEGAMSRLRIATGRLGWGTSERAQAVDLDALRVPDSAVARRASELAAKVSEAWLLEHCLRTYLWGALLGAGDGIPFDEELFYVAALLHDLGLTEAYEGSRPGVDCFAAEGALAAQDFARQEGWSEERAAALAEAIALHINVRVELGDGLEAHLLHEAASLDVVGTRLGEIHPQTREAVLSRYPRLGAKQGLEAAFRHQARRRPASRAALLVRLGMIDLVRRTPFEDSSAG